VGGARALFGLGVPELAVIAGVTALIFGPSKLPEIGKSLGKTVKSFQQVRSIPYPYFIVVHRTERMLSISHFQNF
jgi:TatA/E family protein of Tat protein translocase